MIKVYDNFGIEVPVKFWTFPAGERGVKFSNLMFSQRNLVQVEMLFKGSDDLIDLVLICDAIRELNPDIAIDFLIPYFPYARQDRVCASGESFSLRAICAVINSLNPASVKVQDAHSNVLAAFFKAGVLVVEEQYQLFNLFGSKGDKMLVAPDAGSLKKIYSIAKQTGIPVLEAHKVRDLNTGEIIETRLTNLPDPYTLSSVEEFIVVDDICDGGRTFIELAKVLQPLGKNLSLFVTHGIFSKGKEELEKYYSTIYAVNDLSAV